MTPFLINKFVTLLVLADIMPVSVMFCDPIARPPVIVPPVVESAVEVRSTSVVLSVIASAVPETFNPFVEKPGFVVEFKRLVPPKLELDMVMDDAGDVFVSVMSVAVDVALKPVPAFSALVEKSGLVVLFRRDSPPVPESVNVTMLVSVMSVAVDVALNPVPAFNPLVVKFGLTGALKRLWLPVAIPAFASDIPLAADAPATLRV